ncbi:MAG: glycosyltransferase family 4 protein [Alphaproteobacteria bacterium]|nr:glycosyltransferase family 4 protein [Alphaproteobacteria bacterium]
MAARIAFYAPLKAPTHPTPSGDRQMARLLVRALQSAGAEVDLASDFRSYDGRGDRQRQQALQAEGRDLAAALIDGWRDLPEGRRPTAWFTYHLYHKAPDWLGPAVSAALAIPYLVAEPSFAPKRAGGPWDLGHRAAAEAIAAADWLFCLSRLDMACVRPLVPAGHRLRYLPPFLDGAAFAGAPRERAVVAGRFGLDPQRHWLLAVAMMRPGDKLASYRELAAALRGLAGDDWQLLVAGDGPARAEVEAALSPIARNTVYLGALAAADLPAVYGAADLYVWPGVGEAYGMAYLEAQAAGLPVVAGDERGVPDVVQGGETGLLTPPGNAEAFAAAVRRLLDDDGLRRRFAAAARRFVGKQRAVTSAAERLREALP